MCYLAKYYATNGIFLTKGFLSRYCVREVTPFAHLCT